MTDVTVLTPSFGYGEFIEDCIRSVHAEDGLSIQHVVQDAGSADETLDILKRYSDVVEWVSEPDRGQSDALNRAFERADGKWIAWLNADEFYLPGGLAALVEKGERTSADVVYGDNVFVDEQGHAMRLLPQHAFSELILRTYGCFIASSSMIVRRSSLPEDPWDLDARMMMDWDLYMSLSTAGAKFKTVRYPVGAFRRHSNQVTARPSGEFRDEYQRLFARYGISTRSRRWGKWLHRLAKGLNGAYVRQYRARSVEGRDLRWFDGDEGKEAFGALLRTVYRTRLPASVRSQKAESRGPGADRATE